MLYVPTNHGDVYMKIPDYEEGNDFNQQTKVQTVGMNMKSVIYCTVIKKNLYPKNAIFYLIYL